jgi:hypothetical protein
MMIILAARFAETLRERSPIVWEIALNPENQKGAIVTTEITHECANAQTDKYAQKPRLPKNLSHEDHPGNAHNGAKPECK